MRSLFPDICADDLTACRDFYTSLFGFEIVYEIEWYVQMKHPDNDALQIAFVKRDHPSVPKDDQDAARGVIVTLETDAVDPIYARAKDLDLSPVLRLRDEEWGQRHFMVRDPSGLLVDVVQMIEPSPKFIEEHGLG
jgi:catechol 2,3-dioxygenase-like lactoylglutathione lyase family enzyme